MNNNRDLLEADLDFYSLLNVPRNASADLIQKRFRTLSRFTHPDKNQGREGAEHLFMQIQKAYVYLTNPTTRIIYDRYGVSGLRLYE